MTEQQCDCCYEAPPYDEYSWMDDVDDTCGLEVELRHLGYAGFALICGFAVWWVI